MKVVADESVDGPVVTRLREDGHTVDYLAEMEPGISDDRVLSHANLQQALLITTDKDFGVLVSDKADLILVCFCCASQACFQIKRPRLFLQR